MSANTKLISLRGFELKPVHLMVVGILCLSFSMSFLVRSQAADYGFELNEFDPFFNFRATEYIVDNGIEAYRDWDDSLSWYPHGRDVSATSQVMLHVTAASLYWIFGGGSSLYDFTILFPVVFSSLSAIVLFAVVRKIGGTTAGLIASLLFSVSLPLIIRGPIGWFKSEPLGIFFGLLCTYFLLSGITSGNKKVAAAKIIAGGVFTAFAISSWGGNQFFLIPIGIFFVVLPFLRSDHRFLVWIVPLFVASTMITSLAFERGISTSSVGGIALVAASLFLVLCIFVQKRSATHKRRNGLLLLLSFVIVGSSVLVLSTENDIIAMPSYRYLNAINPFLTTLDPLVDSVSEHATTTLQHSFAFHSVLMIFAGVGIWLLINAQSRPAFIKNDMLAFVLIFGIAGAYISSAFIRLEVFASISIIMLSSIGISILIREFFRVRTGITPTGKIARISLAGGIILLLLVPLVYPPGADTISLSKSPPVILNGGTTYAVATDDWLDAMNWIRTNTPEDSVIASWWDYGYWIQTLGERATLADNSTVSTIIIQDIARMLLASPDQSWMALQEMQADYVLVFVASSKVNQDTTQDLFVLRGGGDESKKSWFMRIAELDESRYLHSDGFSGTDHFWNETLLGQMFPFSLVAYVNPADTQQQSPTYVPGMVSIYEKSVKLPPGGDLPLRLVYSSPSYDDTATGPKLGVFIYEVNKDYVVEP